MFVDKAKGVGQFSGGGLAGITKLVGLLDFCISQLLFFPDVNQCFFIDAFRQDVRLLHHEQTVEQVECL